MPDRKEVYRPIRRLDNSGVDVYMQHEYDHPVRWNERETRSEPICLRLVLNGATFTVHDLGLHSITELITFLQEAREVMEKEEA